MTPFLKIISKIYDSLKNGAKSLINEQYLVKQWIDRNKEGIIFTIDLQQQKVCYIMRTFYYYNALD